MEICEICGSIGLRACCKVRFGGVAETSTRVAMRSTEKKQTAISSFTSENLGNLRTNQTTPRPCLPQNQLPILGEQNRACAERAWRVSAVTETFAAANLRKSVKSADQSEETIFRRDAESPSRTGSNARDGRATQAKRRAVIRAATTRSSWPLSLVNFVQHQRKCAFVRTP